MAIITDDFRRTSARHLENDITSGDTTYYIGVGKADPWFDDDGDEEGSSGFDSTIPAPSPTVIQAREALENLSFMAKVPTTAAYPVIPRINLAAGNVYKMYDPSDSNCFIASDDMQPCYAMNSNRQLFVCIKNGGDADTITQAEVDDLVLSSTSYPFSQDLDSSEFNGLLNPNGGSYVWAYVCTIDNNSGFYTNDYVAVSNSSFTGDTNSDSDTPAEVTGGMLLGFKVLDGGSGYTDPVATVTCRLSDGTNLVLSSEETDDAITIGVTSTVITSVTISTYELIQGRNLDIAFATVHISDPTGTGAIVAAKVAPLDGFGANNLKLLPTYYTGIKAQFPDTLLSASVADGIVGSASVPYDYRQITLIKSPLLTDEADGDDYADCLRYFTISSGTTPAKDDIIWQGSSSSIDDALIAGEPVAYVDHYDADNSRIYYHQNVNNLTVPARVNAAEFASSGTVKHGSGGSLTFNYSSLGTPEYVPYVSTGASDAGYGAVKQNGEVLFIDNRTAVSRSADQTEEIRLVIQF